MVDLREETAYCTICGAPVDPPYPRDTDNHWQTKAVLLCAGESEKNFVSVAATDIVTIPAEIDEGALFLIKGSDPNKVVVPCSEEAYLEESNPNKRLYLPLHMACMSIFYEVAGAAGVAASKDSLGKLWRTLCARFRCSVRHRPIAPALKIYDGYGYYGAIEFQTNEYWDRGESPTGACQYFEADPALRSEDTLMLLQNLKPVPGLSSIDSPAHGTFPQLERLPPELMRKVWAELPPFDDPPEACTYQISPPDWKHALLEGSILPWLPPLDPETVEQKERERAEVDGTQWDWEKLTRHLGRMPFEDGPRALMGSNFEVSQSLWNRRRIWKLAENILSEAEDDYQSE